MGFSEYMDSLGSFAQNHTLIAVLFALCLLFFIYKKPKLFFGMFFIGLFLAVLFYMITSIAGPGAEQKRRMLREEDKQSNTNR